LYPPENELGYRFIRHEIHFSCKLSTFVTHRRPCAYDTREGMGKGWAAMSGRIIVSGDDGLCTYDCPPKNILAVQGLCGIGAICAGEDCLFAASQKENMIWQFHPETLAPMAVFSGGPGISQLMLSRDEKRLYALCSEADSLLMIHAQSGMPLMLARAGVNPCAMALDERK
jgi:hypothetical protein